MCFAVKADNTHYTLNYIKEILLNKVKYIIRLCLLQCKKVAVKQGKIQMSFELSKKT